MSDQQASKHTNKLINETSPYLLQHAHNPVDWYPWGEEALNRSKAENKPILLSVGYSACHWCHVMERESFENEEIAALMNRHFISIKVDREERPDIDSLYMDAVVALTGQGGWPMTVFLTPEGVPFYGGTYFAPVQRYPNQPSFPDVLNGIATTYHDAPDDIAHNAAQLKNLLQQSSQGPLIQPGTTLEPAMLDRAWLTEGHNAEGRPVRYGLAASFDPREGGLGRAPKFPQPMALDFTLRTYHRTHDQTARQLLDLTLTKMAWGGLYDQLGGGFHRYSTDSKWLAPHFEKMLYDNAQLSLLYLQAFQATGTDLYKTIAVETLEYVVREMINPQGGFYSTQDADSEGVEGKFFVWSQAEITQALGPEDAALFSRYYDVTPKGNWEGHNILHVTGPLEEIAAAAGVTTAQLAASLERSKKRLWELREKRIHPNRDEKVLTSWNGLMLKSFAQAARILDRADFRQIAVANANFILSELSTPDGRLYRTYKDGKAHLKAFLEDYSYYADGLLSLYEATFDLKWLEEAKRLAEIMLDKFWDETGGTFYDTASDGEELVARPRSLYDNAVPSGNAVAADLLFHLALLTGDPAQRYAPKALSVLNRLGPLAAESPAGFGRVLGVLDFHFSNPLEIVIVGNEDEPATRALLSEVTQPYLPNRVLMLTPDGLETTAWPLLEFRQRIDGKPTAYVCQGYTCQYPVTDPAELAKQLLID